ncbi:MAG: acetyl-CoA carboxylase biotin carboxyl carrier protein [candidate division KSB1 bacterium]|nr:acetyl-CoA carboxylase biotin carboxyl carrier protein [candidate division KSB1 bacterium]MDZ7364604.1 acetyl-CoA carboxylase biotin carboxyl carrier protein [candidate division KSB1 bacterium]MDZ7402648.1 acetyl-CoA carboxylase biotin carboxyl carrier protein [candidate division KSB1 bacterium]
MNEDEIRRLVKIVEESGIADLEVSRWGRKVKISKYPSNSHLAPPFPMTHVQIPTAATPAPAVSPSPAPSGELPKTAAEAPAPAKNLIEIKSPMVGTFYRAPGPDADPYVQIGTTVSKGQVLCIIEAMKLMNEIEAEFPCRIAEILVENGQPVEYNQPLFRVEKT